MTFPRLTLRMNNLHPRRTTPQEPQNLLRPTTSGCPTCEESAAMSGLAGLGRGAMRLSTLGQVTEEDIVYQTPRWLQVTYGILSTASMVAGAYHGYKRHDSVWGALGWAFLGAMFWPISMPVAFAQGFGQRK